ncbi:MAG: HDIG domain-containing protein [Patescibacteria group bacterium]|nr:HDIG domain-containing protein [Patescibacteria group bacterium]
MDLGINKIQADQLVDKYIANPVTKYHLLESEAIMRALAKHFGENEEEWGIIGLLHDIDWDLTKNNPQEHLTKAPDILKQAGAADELINVIVSHGYDQPACGAPQDKHRQARIEHALAAAETLTGLIVASALVQPDKKLASVNVPSLSKKFKSKNFAAKCDRNIILECEKIGLTLEQFLEIGLKALQEMATKIGL